MSINSSIAKKLKEVDKLFNKRVRGVEKELLESYTKSYKDIRKQLLNLYSNFKGKPTLFQASQFNRLSNLNKQIASILEQLKHTQATRITNATAKEFGEGYYSVGYQLEAGIQANFRFGLLDPEVVRKSVQNPLDLITWKDTQADKINLLKKGVRAEVTTGIQTGRAPNKTAKAIRKKLGKHFSNDIPRIVRTETQRARSWGSLTGDLQAQQYAKEAGIDMKRMWLATLDSKTREDHQAMDGQYENKNNEFVFPNGVVTTAPLLSGDPAQDINCRCTTIEVVDNETPKQRYDQEQGKRVPFKKYSDYKSKWINKKKSPIKEPADLFKQQHYA